MPRALSLHLVNFRNFESADLEFHPTFNVITGKNGAGKSNLLEALFYLSIGKSNRGVSSAQLVKSDAAQAQASMHFSAGDVAHEIRADITSEERRFFFDGAKARSPAEIFGQVGMVSYSPDTLWISSGPPPFRRRFMNMLLSQSDINYFIDIQRYTRILAQRNAYLKSGAGDRQYLGVLTGSMIDLGSKLRKKRALFSDNFQPIARRHLEYLSDKNEDFGLFYSACASVETVDFGEQLKAEFDQARTRETIFKTTLCGPHRDDLILRFKSREARKHASRGELRTLALALELAAVDYLKEVKGAWPILLLDDIFSELDEPRSQRLLENVQGTGQVFLAAAQTRGLPLPSEGRRFTIRDGALLPSGAPE